MDVGVVGDVVVNLVGDGDMNVDDNGGDQIHVAVAVNVVDDDDDDHVRVNIAHHAPSDRNHWRRREDYNRRRSHPCYDLTMKLLVRAVVTGFGLSLGAALYKRVAKQLGFDDRDGSSGENAASGPSVIRHDGATDPGLQRSPT